MLMTSKYYSCRLEQRKAQKSGNEISEAHLPGPGGFVASTIHIGHWRDDSLQDYGSSLLHVRQGQGDHGLGRRPKEPVHEYICLRSQERYGVFESSCCADTIIKFELDPKVREVSIDHFPNFRMRRHRGSVNCSEFTWRKRISHTNMCTCRPLFGAHSHFYKKGHCLETIVFPCPARRSVAAGNAKRVAYAAAQPRAVESADPKCSTVVAWLRQTFPCERGISATWRWS